MSGAGKPEDRLDLDVKYPRATAGKALLDWLYLGESKYSKIAGPRSMSRSSASTLRD
jgi:hypothetical protein